MSAYKYIEEGDKPVELLDLLLLWWGARPTYRAKVEELARLMLDGIALPALRVVIGLGGAFWQPMNGHHRAAASQLCGFSHVPCIVLSSPWSRRA